MPYPSGYYEATKDILESTTRLDKKFERGGLDDEEVPKSISSNEPVVGFESEAWATDMGPKPEITSAEPKKEIISALTSTIKTETKVNPSQKYQRTN